MKCLGCGWSTIESPWGAWCDNCGGVVVAMPPQVVDGLLLEPHQLFFRHVATVYGEKIAYPSVFDVSANAYGVAWPRPLKMVQCIHCGLKTPGDDPRTGLGRLDDLKTQLYYSKRGSFDEILATIQPIARGDSPDLPRLSPAPSATDEERQRIEGP